MRLKSTFHPGDRVVYVPDSGGRREEGTVTSVGERFVFVCYGLPGSTSKAARASQLEIISTAHRKDDE